MDTEEFDYEKDRLTPLENFVWGQCPMEHGFGKTRNGWCHYCDSLKSGLIRLAQSGAFTEYIKQ